MTDKENLFDARLEVDYKDFVDFSKEEASEFVTYAKEFLSTIKKFNG